MRTGARSRLCATALLLAGGCGDDGAASDAGRSDASRDGSSVSDANGIDSGGTDGGGGAVDGAGFDAGPRRDGGPAVLFESNWDTAIGTSREAVTDGDRWPTYDEFNGGDPVQLLTVVPEGPPGYNALRVEQRGEGYAANIQVDDIMPESTDYYVRFYMRNDDTSGSGDHIVTVDIYEYPNLTFIRKYGSAAGWSVDVSLYGCGEAYPLNHLGPPDLLRNEEWYRFEYFVDFVDATHVQVHPRIYDASGALVYDDDDFEQQDYMGGGDFMGRDDWTLASYYAAGYDFCVEPPFMNDFGMGNNGQTGAADTMLPWFFAAVQIRSDTWPGP